ncbi:MAG: 4-hydroxy-tetrahydrodipicolinate synthase [Candidatus Latescibacterota bacterium]|jgi:4-hydroxy-tetrahydrodipicolinate synthase
MPELQFKGVFPILITPFASNEDLDLDSFAGVVNFMAEIGVDGITILGVLGESNRLLDCEREELIKTAIDAAAARIPVVVGTSYTGTRATLRLSQMAESLGAAAVMVTPSREAVPNEERIFEYFQQVAEGISIPIVAQDHPASTQVHMSAGLVLKLVGEIPQIACIKQEAVPTAPKTRTLIAGMEGRRRATILTGLGALYGRYDLESGADGFMTGFAFPEVLQAFVAARNAGDETLLCDLYQRFLPLIVFEQQPGVAVRKEIFRLRGLIESGHVRHPGRSIDAGTAQHLSQTLDSILPGMDIKSPLAL